MGESRAAEGQIAAAVTSRQRPRRAGIEKTPDVTAELVERIIGMTKPGVDPLCGTTQVEETAAPSSASTDPNPS